MAGFDPVELMRSIEEVIPEHARPDPYRVRELYLVTRIADKHLDFARAFYAIRGELDKAVRLSGVTVEVTISDMPLVMSVPSTSGAVVIFDRGVSGAISHVAEFLALYGAFDATRSSTKVFGPPAKPVDHVIAYFFRSYFRSFRWAGNLVQRFDVRPEGKSIEFEIIVRFWAVTFLLFHEFAHIANGDTNNAATLTRQNEMRVDEQALEMMATLAHSQLFAEDLGFALVGAQIALLTLVCMEWAYFLSRPTTHPPAMDRLIQLNTIAFQTQIFPTGSVLWSQDVAKPIVRLCGILGEPLLPPFESQYDQVLGAGRFFLPVISLGLEGSVAYLKDYERFDRHMSYPIDDQMSILARALELAPRDVEDSIAEQKGYAWCKLHLARERELMVRSCAGGLGFRDALELSMSRWEELPYSVRIAAMAWCLRQAGWDPEAEGSQLSIDWLR